MSSSGRRTFRCATPFARADPSKERARLIGGPAQAEGLEAAERLLDQRRIFADEAERAGANTGNFVIAIQRLNNPVGCTALTFGNPATAAAISTVGELDCYTFTGSANDDTSLGVVETSNSPPFLSRPEIVRPNGSTNCGGTTANPLSCTTDSDGTYTIVVADDTGSNTGDYNISITT